MAWQDRAYNRDGGTSGLRFGFTPPSRMALCVMGACFVVYILQRVSPLVVQYACLTFIGANPFIQIWRFVTYQYVHGEPLHIFFNLIGIYFFLPPLERLWGPAKAFAFYTTGGIVGGLGYCLLHLLIPGNTLLIGASGSILAALGACALLFPEQIIYILVFPVPIRMLAALLALLYTLTVIGEHDYANACHLAGLAFGVMAPYYGAGMWARLNRRAKNYRVRRDRQIERDEQEAIDRILQKVSESGMHSLNGGERRALKRATDRQRRRDAELARGRRF